MATWVWSVATPAPCVFNSDHIASLQINDGENGAFIMANHAKGSTAIYHARSMEEARTVLNDLLLAIGSNKQTWSPPPSTSEVDAAQ